MIVCLINGVTTVRSRESEGTTILPCGCAYTDFPYMWNQMCREHSDVVGILHDRAQADHARDAAVKELTS